MDDMLKQNLIQLYNFKNPIFTPISIGLINSTYKIIDNGATYIFQQINTHIFKNPLYIDSNITQIQQFLKLHFPDYIFPAFLYSIHHKSIEIIHNNYCRVYKSILNVQTFNTALNENMAYLGAFQFGNFTAKLANFNIKNLHIPLPDFHNLIFIESEYQKAIQQNNDVRKSNSKNLIHGLKKYHWILPTYINFINHPESKKRVIHHDTKINNVLFNMQNEAVCIIDLDTIMPGYFISDLGDLIRTYTCAVSENEKNIHLIEIRKPFLEKVIDGYTTPLLSALSNFEKDHIIFAGYFMIYMQAIRFLKDYLENDRYYGASYEMQNYDRANNQFYLLEKYNQIYNHIYG